MKPTRAEVLTEPAGARLDGWVAEFVNGIIPRDVRARGSTDFVPVWSNNRALCDGVFTAAELHRHGAPMPVSSETSAALVLLGEWPGDFLIRRQNGVAWKCELFKPSREWEVWAGSLAEAVAKAVLLATIEV